MNYPDLPDPALSQAFFEVLSRSETPCILLHEGIIEWINDAVEQLIGFDKNDILGHYPMEFGEMINQVDSRPIDIEQVRREVIAEQKKVTDALVFKVNTKEDEIRWLKFVVYPFLHEMDHYSIIMLQDITAFKEKDEKLQLLMNLSIVAFLIEQEGSIMYINPAFTSIMGYTEDDVKSWAPYEYFNYIYGEDKAAVNEWVQKLASTEDHEDITHSFFRVSVKSGKVRWIEIFVERGYFNGIAARVVIIFDVTEKHMLEQQLLESDERFRIIAQQSALGIAIIQDGKFAFVNEIIAGILGQSATELSNAAVLDYFDILPEQLRSDIEHRYREHMLGKMTGNNNYVIQVPAAGGLKHYEVATRNIIINDRAAIIFTTHDVTGLFDAQQELKESEEKFRSIAEESALGIFIVQDGNIVFANEKFADMVEKTLEEIINTPVTTLIAIIQGNHRSHIEDQYKIRTSGELREDTRYVLPVLTESGKQKQFEVFARSIMLGGRDATLAITLDITDRIVTEQNLKESEEKFKTIAEKSFLGIVLMQDGLVKYLNAQAAQVYEYSLQEMLDWTSQHFLMKILPEDRVNSGHVFTAHDAVSNNDTVREATFRIISKSGNRKWIQVYSNTVLYQGKSADMIIINDITDRKESELVIAQSELKYRQLFEQSAEGILLMDHKGTFFECNSTAEKILNLEKNDIIGKNFKDFQQYLLTDLSFARSYLRLANQGQATEPFELEATSTTRGIMWLRCSVSRINYGKERANQLIIHDITEKKKLESMLQQENEKLRQLDTMRKNFIFTATHELKTPLVSLYGASDFLLQVMPETLDNSLRNIITIIHKGAERLKALVDNMLDVSRMDTGNLQINKEDVDMVDIVSQALESLDYLVQISEQEIIKDIPESLLAKVDKLRMEQVITNLLSNAIKNTQKGGCITIRLSQEGPDMMFSITDNGVGLTKDEMDVLFTQFGKLERTDLNTAVNIQGSGLGLFISKNIVEMHDGTIWAESAGRDKGSTFYFTIPTGG